MLYCSRQMGTIRDREPITLSSSREELITTIFHELRTPISSISGYASLLLTEELGQMGPKQKQTLARIQEL